MHKKTHGTPCIYLIGEELTMIINKVSQYWTEEDRQRLEEIEREQDTIISALMKERESAIVMPQNINQLNKWHELEQKANQIRADVEQRYIKANGKKAILADVEEIVTAIEKTDFLASIATQLSQIATLKAEGVKEESLAPLRGLSEENYINCYNYILLYLRVQLNAFAGDERNTDKILAIVEKRVALWYVKPQPAYMPMAHGKATDALAFMNSRTAKTDAITGNATIDKFGVQLVIMKMRELQSKLGISTDKLLSTAIATFTKQNDFRHTKSKEPRRDVTIPLREYAKLLGYDVEEHETSTPEEAEREKKRAKNQLDNARKAIKEDLDIIHASTLTWEEPIKGKARDFARVSLVTFTGIRNGEIKISFSPEIARYLSERNLITQYPTKLLRISGRQPNAYYIGRKLAEHYNIDNNQIRGTCDRISIPKLLEVTDLPSYEDVQKKDRGHWAERIKEPLERALDTLTQEGVLKDWKYTHAKGVDLTEEEAYTITRYEDYAKLYLHFTPADKVDHTERIIAKQKAREEARKKKRKTSSKKKS